MTQLRADLRTKMDWRGNLDISSGRKLLIPIGWRDKGRGQWYRVRGWDHPVEARITVAISRMEKEGPPAGAEATEEIQPWRINCLKQRYFQGFLGHGPVSAETRRVLDKPGQVGHSGTQRSRGKKLSGFFFLSPLLSPVSASHWLDPAGSQPGKKPEGVRPTTIQSRAGKKLEMDLRVNTPTTGTATWQAQKFSCTKATNHLQSGSLSSPYL